MKRTRTVQLLAGGLIAGAGLWIFFRDVNPARLGQELTSHHPLVLLACAGLVLFSLKLRAIRWGIMLPRVRTAHNQGLFGHVMIGFMVNNIVPARVGEAARVLLLWRKNGYGVTIAIGSLILERTIDVVVFGTFFIFPVLVLEPLEPLRRYALLMAAGCGFAGLVFILYVIAPGLVRTGFRRALAILPVKLRQRVKVTMEELASNLDWTSSPARIGVVLVLSYVIAFCFALMLLLLSDQFTLPGIVRSMFAQACAVMGAAIPLSPGYVGTLHAALLEGLTYLGQSRETARAIAILYHALAYVPVTVVGLVYFFRTDLRFRDLSHAKEDLKEQTQETDLAQNHAQTPRGNDDQ